MTNSQIKKGQCIALMNKVMYMPILEGLNAVDVIESTIMTNILLCPKCKKGRMVKNRGDS